MKARLVIALTVAFLNGAEEPKAAKDTKKDIESLQGEWTMVSMETRGKNSRDRQEASTPGDDITVDATPPVVVKTVPQAGMKNVNAKTTEIQVTFSKDMTNESWSWSQLSDETFPKIIGKPKYLKDKRTCVVTVKLEADKTYAIWLNSEQFHNFKDADGRPAVPYLLVFKTAK
jgi:RNA polymerase sigma-70 factor (ECF subfamily)